MALFGGKNNNSSYFLIRILTLAAIGLVFTVIGFGKVIGAAVFKADVQKSYENGVNFIPDMTSADYKKGLNVYGDVLYSYGCFCEETSTRKKYGVEISSKVTGSYYLTPVWEDDSVAEKYVTVLVHSKDSISAMDDITDDTLSYIGGKDVNWHDFYMLGKVIPLEKDVREFMIDAFKSGEWFDSYDEATIDKYVVPFVIEEYDPDAKTSSGWATAIIGLIFLVAGAAVFIFMFVRKKNSGGYDNSYGQENYQQNYDLPAKTLKHDTYAQAAQRSYEQPQDGAYTPPQQGTYTQPQPTQEAYAAPEESYPQVKQPDIDPDEFFARPARPAKKPAPVAPAPAPKQEAAPESRQFFTVEVPEDADPTINEPMHDDGTNVTDLHFVGVDVPEEADPTVKEPMHDDVNVTDLHFVGVDVPEEADPTISEPIHGDVNVTDLHFVGVDVPEEADPTVKEPMHDGVNVTDLNFVTVEVPENADPEEKEPIRKAPAAKKGASAINELSNGAYLVEEDGIRSGLNTDALDLKALGYDDDYDEADPDDSDLLFM